MKKHSSSNLLFISSIVLIIILSSILLRAPKPLPISTNENEFSAERAFEHVKNIAQKPHMIGTEEHESVKNYIIHELQNIGLQTEVQTTTAINEFRGVARAGYVQNIIGTIKGKGKNKSVLIVGHYDSQPSAKGAADDGSAVAAMLEAASTLKQNEQLQNDIIFLFTDAEEVGLLGAKAFIDEHHLKYQIGIVLNLEARGTKGPSITFEVSPENGWIMREYIKAVPYPIAQSIAYEVYKILPNDTDFTLFKNEGLSGFNTAFTDGYVNYHSMTDSPENLSLASLQHQGSYIMGVAKHFGNIDLNQTKSKDAVFFNIVGFKMILYPASLNIVLIVLISLLFVFYIFLGLQKRRISILKTVLSIFIFVFAFALTLAGLWLLQKAIINSYPHYTLFHYWNFYNIKHYFVAFTALAIAIFSFVYVLLSNKIGIENLFAGIVIVVFGAMFPLQIYFPTGSYILIIPLLFILLANVICYLFNLTLKHTGKPYLIFYFILLIPIIFLYVPLIKLFYVIFGLKLIFAGIALLVILLSFLLVFINVLAEIKRWFLPVIAFLLFIVFILAGHFSSNYSKKQPLQSNVMYCLNADENQAFWVSENLQTDEWNNQFFTHSDTGLLTEIFPLSVKPKRINQAPVLEFTIPTFQVLHDTIEAENRIVELQIESTRNADYFEIYIHKNAQLSEIKINGKSIKNNDFYILEKKNYYCIYYFGLYNNGVKLWLNSKNKEPFELVVVEKKMGLPIPENYSPMPDFIIPYKDYNSNLSIVKCSCEI
ncbi:MAG: hypothetical protein A2041_14520 [Bacteroidetes bacterium GWA2_31_9b]|nr:MAG: hypothetical protein A2041_14520 [Bacteroidetes bacterium GWA2_31_9b]